MPLEELPTEILCAISQDVAAFGSSQLVGLVRTSRRLHAICESILYATDVRETGGRTSMHHGLKTGLSNVVELCLSAGVDPNIRIESLQDLDTELGSVSRTPPSPFPSGYLDDEVGYGYFDETADYDDAVGSMPFESDDAFYWTPLHVAATHDDIELLSLLLQHGANPNSAGRGVCPCYYNPLRRTFERDAHSRNQDIPEILDRRIATRWSPLHVAVCNGKLNCARELLSRFGLARPIESDDAVLAESHRFFDDEPTLAPIAYYNPPVFNEFTPRFDPLPPLHVAVDKYASVEAIEELYAMLEKAGCLGGPHSGVDVLDAFGDTPFAVAAFSGRIKTVGSWLRDRGADVNAAIRDSEGQRRSIFNALCGADLYADALFLMDMGVDINRDVELTSGGRHMSALHWCCGRGLARPQQREAILVLKRLVHAGADVNAKAERGITPLMNAIKLQQPDAVLELLQAKADVGAEDDSGNCALHHAVQHALSLEPSAKLSAAQVVIQLLLDSGADPNQHSESRGPSLFTLQYKLQGTPAISYREGDPMSTPFDVARHNMVWIAPLLISRGADPNMYLKDPRDIEKEDFEEMLEEFGGRSLAVTAFYRGEFDSLDSLLAWGTIVTGPDYLLMLRSLIDPSIEDYRTRPGAVGALFRVLNSASLRLERFEDRKGIMDAWTEVLYIAVGSRPMLVPLLAPHISLTSMCGPGGKTVLHLMVQWERKRYESPAQFDERIRAMMIHLFRCGAGRQIDELDNSGRSPLFLAVDRGNIPVAKQLVQLGASLHIEQNKPYGSQTISPLKLAIKSYTKARRFKIAVEMLEASRSIHGSTVYFCKNSGFLKDLILHFGGNAFDNPSRMPTRTTKLMEKLLDKGIDVNESDEHGNTALHHLIQLLYPSNGGLNKPGVSSFRLPIRAVRNAGTAKYPPGTDPAPKRHFELSAEQDMQMNGHNVRFPYDRDHEDQEVVWTRPDYDGSAEGDDSDSSDIVEATELFSPRNELGELANHDPRVASNRCKAWMSTFVFLLDRGAILTMSNNAGKTALDYIDELRGGQARACPKMYGPVIPALRDYVKRPPFDAELLAKLDQADLTAKGTPLLLVHDHIHLVSMDKDGPEAIRKAESEASEKGKTCWLPFW